MKTQILLPSLMLMACASCASRTKPLVTVYPASVPAATLTGPVRHAEVVRSYHVGRYVDPQHADLMHEQHSFYRVESSARWNLRPGLAAEQGGVGPYADAAFSPAPSSDAIVAELNRQKEVTERVMREASQLAASYAELQRVIKDMSVVAKNHGWMAPKVLESERRVKELETELRQLSTTLSTPVPVTGMTTNVPSAEVSALLDPLFSLPTVWSNKPTVVR